MYIEKALYENIGPISNVHITFPFEENGNPKPVILVGKNGSGKSTVLSNIVDAFYEMAGVAFDNAREQNERSGQQYYKIINPIQIRTGQQYMLSCLKFKGKSPSIYIFKAGNISAEIVRSKIGIYDKKINWESKENYKTTTLTGKDSETIWKNNVICYFGPDRYERPFWMGDKYHYSNDYVHPSIHNKISRFLDKPITVQNVTDTNLTWLLDVIADSRPDVYISPTGQIRNERALTSSLMMMGLARYNLENIISEILGEDVFFSLNLRNRFSSRFAIRRKEDETILVPTLDSLSTGQIALFNMFSTIVRYADYNDINKSISLHDIRGIVVIDEIELHLHTKLQKEVLPKLMKLFPKIQFIITTHAPLFLLGMKESFGEDHFEVYELPDANRINTERFSEFQRAYRYLQETETYQKNIEVALNAVQQSEKTLVITEGSTDWKHLKAAFENLKTKEIYKDIFSDLNFDFLEYEPSESPDEAKYKLKMGNTVLVSLCENMSKLPQPVKYIFIADRDDEQTNRKLSDSNSSLRYKNWGNNVFSMILPLPKHRKETPGISIEHFYTDKEIKTEWIDSETHIAHRLFMGYEFDERGIASDIDRYCERKNKCGKSKISIIEGSSGEKVTSISDNQGINFALPKSKFAKLIYEKEEPFDKFNFDSFIEVFEIIKEIVNVPSEE